jgi:hypothetical protein
MTFWTEDCHEEFPLVLRNGWLRCGQVVRRVSRLTFSMYMLKPRIDTAPATKTIANAARLSRGELLDGMKPPLLLRG